LLQNEWSGYHELSTTASMSRRYLLVARRTVAESVGSVEYNLTTIYNKNINKTP